jgi:hypothetical protein
VNCCLLSSVTLRMPSFGLRCWPSYNLKPT